MLLLVQNFVILLALPPVQNAVLLFCATSGAKWCALFCATSGAKLRALTIRPRLKLLKSGSSSV